MLKSGVNTNIVMKSLSIFLIVFFCILFFWIPIALGATILGVLAGIFGALVGLIGGIFGLIAGLIGGFIKLLVHIITFPFHWDLSSGKIYVILAMILVIVIALQSRQNNSAKQ